MSSYMKGYNSRNDRRRRRYERKYHATGRRAYRARQRKRNGKAGAGTWTLRIVICIVVLAGLLFGANYIWNFYPMDFLNKTPQSQTETVTGGAVSTRMPEATGGAISTRTPEVTQTDVPQNPSPQTQVSAQPVSVSAVSVPSQATQAANSSQPTQAANSSQPTAAGPTMEPGGLAEIVSQVEPLPTDVIAPPKKAPRSKAVALTFDDGPSTLYTNSILDVLERYQAHATFFVVGERVQSGAEILKREIALGCEIGSHSYDHANLSKLNIAGINKQNGKTTKLIKKLTGYKVKLMRPPYGAVSKTMRKKMKFPMILWSVDTLDWKSRNAKAVFKEVKRQVSDGDIILVHDIHGSTAEAMKKVIPWLVENDYDILTVSELMERKGIKLKNGVAYGSAH